MQRKRYAHLTDEEWRWLLQQVEGRQRTRGKLPTMAEIADWWYPVRLSCEQCSSEETARYKAKILHDASKQVRGEEVLVDLTGGYGVDTYFLSENFAEVHYVEQDEELCRIAKHNFALTRPQIQVHNMHAEEFLKTDVTDKKWVVYIDPARRDKHGGKVFRIEDCEPNVVEILPALKDKAERIIIKLSPMLDITAALRSLAIPMDIHVVAVNNEVKEVQLWSKEENSPSRIHAVNLGSQTTEFSFVVEEEKNAQ